MFKQQLSNCFVYE